jgi:phenylalanyl-tRNA synthetase beta chain
MENIKLGKIVSIDQHPNADKLKVLQLLVEDNTIQVVTNFGEIKVGDEVVVALIGAELKSPEGDFKIKKSKLRGVESFGMLCDEEGLGLPKTFDRILFKKDIENLKIDI